MKKKKAVALFMGVVGGLCLLSVPVLLMQTEKESSFRRYRKKYSLDEWKAIETASFRPLNSIVYPDETYKKEEVDEAYITAVSDFAYRIYDRISAQKANSSFSPLGLYANLDLISSISSDEAAKEEFDLLLGLDADKRKANFFRMQRTDCYVEENGTIQMHNGVFFTDDYSVDPTVVGELTSRRAEAYQIDFQNESAREKMLSWIDRQMGEKGFIDEKDLEIDADTAMLFLTTVYFSNRWENMFSASNSETDTFYGSERNEQITYMRHTYAGIVYDYGDYVSFYDAYTNGAKIQYLIPKSVEDSIDELVKGVDFLKEDEEARLPGCIIDLSVPKFTSEAQFDFTETLKEEGLNLVFDRTRPSLNGAFTDADQVVYLQYVRQKSSLSFDEDGTEIKSLTFSKGSNKAIGPAIEGETMKIQLNQPFLYVVYDSNDLPLYMGKVDQPN